MEGSITWCLDIPMEGPKGESWGYLMMFEFRDRDRDIER